MVKLFLFGIYKNYTYVLTLSYAQSLVAKTKKELKELNEKMEKQIMQMLIQEEANHNISKQLRYWRSKAMSMEVNNHFNKKKVVFHSEIFYTNYISFRFKFWL